MMRKNVKFIKRATSIVLATTLLFVGTTNFAFADDGDEGSNSSVQTYSGSGVTPYATIKVDGVTLTEGTDYDVVYTNNVNVGQATATITFKGNYSGTTSTTFNINAKSISGSDVTASLPNGTSYAYDWDEPIKPAVSVVDSTRSVTLTQGTTTTPAETDYQVRYLQADKATEVGTTTPVGTYYVEVKGVGNYTDTTYVEYTVGTLTIDNTAPWFADLSATLKVNGASGTLNKDTVDKSKITVTGVVDDQAYTGAEIKPVPSIQLGGATLVEGIDYTSAYSDNLITGTGYITVTLNKNYTGIIVLPFNITSLALTESNISEYIELTAPSDVTFNNSEQAQKPVLKNKKTGATLAEGTDYTITYRYEGESEDVTAPKKAGKVNVTITFTKDFSGSTTTSYNISQYNIEMNNVNISPIADQTYTGNAITPNITIEVTTSGT